MGKLFMPMFTFAGSDHCHVGRKHSACRNLPRSADCCSIRRHQPRERMSTSLRQSSLFDVLMSGVLGQLRDVPMPARRNKEMELATKAQRRHPWVNRINMQGFEFEEISVKVDDYMIHITAKHTEEFESGNDVIERFRKVPLPQDVDAEKLSCFIAENGTLILRAPYNTSKSDLCPRACDMHGKVSGKDTGCKQTRETGKENGNERSSNGHYVDTETTNVPAISISDESINSNCYAEENTPDNRLLDQEDGTTLPNVYDCTGSQDERITDTTILTTPVSDSASNTEQEIEPAPEDDVKAMKYRPDANETTSMTESKVVLPDDTDDTDVSHESIDFVIIDKEGEQLPRETTQVEKNVSAQANNDVVTIEDLGNEDHSITFDDVSTRGTKEGGDAMFVNKDSLDKEDMGNDDHSHTFTDVSTEEIEEIEEGGDVMSVKKDSLDKEDLANGDHSFTITDNSTRMAENSNPNGRSDVMHANNGVLDIKEVGNDVNEERSIPLMDESTRIIEEPDNTKRVEFTLDLQPFKPEHTSLRCSNGTLLVDVEKEVETDSGEIAVSGNVHREFSLPANGVMNEAVAAMNQAGLLRVTVPLRSES